MLLVLKLGPSFELKCLLVCVLVFYLCLFLGGNFCFPVLTVEISDSLNKYFRPRQKVNGKFRVPLVILKFKDEKYIDRIYEIANLSTDTEIQYLHV